MSQYSDTEIDLNQYFKSTDSKETDIVHLLTEVQKLSGITSKIYPGIEKRRA